MRHVLLSLILATSAGFAYAQSPEQPATEVAGVTVVARRATPVAGVTVTANACPEPDAARYRADPQPAIIDSYPKPNSLIAPGALMLRASFNGPMSCYWDVTSDSDGGDDPCQDSGRWALPARTTWTMECRLKPRTHYTIRFGEIDGHGFIGRSGQAAPAFALSFDTSDEDPISPVEAQRLSLESVRDQPVTAYVACSAHPNREGVDCVRADATTTR